MSGRNICVILSVLNIKLKRNDRKHYQFHSDDWSTEKAAVSRADIVIGDLFVKATDHCMTERISNRQPHLPVLTYQRNRRKYKYWRV